MASSEWWREALFYQIYPRSFADSNGDGVGDLLGVVSHLDYLVDLGVDALWLSPFYPSPQVDAGYDVADYCDVDPLFGSLADFDLLLSEAHSRGMKVTIDVVPNHCSVEHPWFRAAVAAGRGSEERSRFHFLEGRGENGELPPNNWGSAFGGPSWTRVTEPDGTPGQWYYHLFAAEQPDFNWEHPAVIDEFERVFRFWLDRGVDGFRIDVSDALIKDTSWADTDNGQPLIPKDADSPIHDIYRRLRSVMNEYDGDRMAVIETGAADDIVALFIRPDEMHLAFNFRFSKAAWGAAEFRAAVRESLAANSLVGATTTWVTDNHDNPRTPTRHGRNSGLVGSYVPTSSVDGAADLKLGHDRAEALALFLLCLPGATYVYNGQELGLPNVDDLPESELQDPIFFRTAGAERGRDGCRVPLPWAGDEPPFGFSAPGVKTWLSQPRGWAELTVEAQEQDRDSMLWLYRGLIALRRELDILRRGDVEVLDRDDDLVVVRLTHGQERAAIVVNFGDATLPMPQLDQTELLAISRDECTADALPANSAVLLALA